MLLWKRVLLVEMRRFTERLHLIFPYKHSRTYNENVNVTLHVCSWLFVWRRTYGRVVVPKVKIHTKSPKVAVHRFPRTRETENERKSERSIFVVAPWRLLGSRMESTVTPWDLERRKNEAFDAENHRKRVQTDCRKMMFFWKYFVSTPVCANPAISLQLSVPISSCRGIVPKKRRSKQKSIKTSPRSHSHERRDGTYR